MTRMDKRVGFIGAGNMAEAMINGLIKSSLSETNKIWTRDHRKNRLQQLKKK